MRNETRKITPDQEAYVVFVNNSEDMQRNRSPGAGLGKASVCLFDLPPPPLPLVIKRDGDEPMAFAMCNHPT
jgi:hypothetical protein